MKGKVKWFDKKKGYGFIEGEDGRDYFVHFSDVEKDGFRALEEGEEVEFEPQETDRGTKAIKVRSL